MTRLLLLFFTFIFFASCEDSRPKNVLNRQVMTSVLTDLHLADGYTTTLSTSDKKGEIAALYKSVYKNHNTDSIQVRKSLAFYTENPQELLSIYAEIDSNLVRAQRVEERLTADRATKERIKMLQDEALSKIRNKYITDSIARISGHYDFALPSYFSTLDPYITIYRNYPTLAKATTNNSSIYKKSFKADSLKKDSLKQIFLRNPKK